jgi:hypothetical protein
MSGSRRRHRRPVDQPFRICCWKATLNASAGLVPARPPRFQMPVRKLPIMLLSVTHVPGSFGSNT